MTVAVMIEGGRPKSLVSLQERVGALSVPDTAMQHSLSSEQTLLTAWTFGSYEQLRTRASPFHLNLCRLERGDDSPQHFLRLPLSALHLAVCHTVTLPVWSLCGQSQGSLGLPSTLLGSQGSANAATAPAPARHRPQRSYTDPSEEGLLHTLSLDWVTNAGCCMTWDTTGTLDSYWRQLCCFMPMSAFAATYSARARPVPALLQVQAH